MYTQMHRRGHVRKYRESVFPHSLYNTEQQTLPMFPADGRFVDRRLKVITILLQEYILKSL